MEDLESTLGDPEEISSSIESSRRNAIYFERNLEALMIKYGEGWVAIVDEKDVAYHKSFIRVLRLLDELGIESRNAYVQYLGKDQRPQILEEQSVLSLPIGI